MPPICTMSKEQKVKLLVLCPLHLWLLSVTPRADGCWYRGNDRSSVSFSHQLPFVRVTVTGVNHEASVGEISVQLVGLSSGSHTCKCLMVCRSLRAGRTDHLDHLESEVSEVTHLLKQNVEKVVERGERIDDLQSRSEELQAGSHHFNRRAGQVRRQMCWKNCRLNCIIASVVLGIIAAITIIVLVTVKPWEDSSGHGHNSTLDARGTFTGD